MTSAAAVAIASAPAPIAAKDAADKARLANPEVESVLGSLGTETRNPKTYALSSLPTLDMVTLINNEDATIADAVKAVLPQVAKAIDAISERLAKGGRLLYFGAGTSGRIGVLDASEIPPTFGASHELVVGVMAGGDYAIRLPVEGIEDDADAAVVDAKANNITANDSVVGLSASGRAPYVLAVCDYARQVGALAIGVATNAKVPLETHVDILINPVVGNEALTGSTRMKSGTAQKLVLNMLSTGSMIRMGKTYSNLMVDMKLANRKLEIRAARMVANAVGVSPDEGERLLTLCNRETKTAIMVGAAGVTPEEARKKLDENKGVLSKALSGYTLRPEAIAAARGPVQAKESDGPSSGDKLSTPGGEKVHLVIDGGGTKTLAVLVSEADPSKEFGRGIAGTTNLNAVAPETVVDRVVEAGKNAAAGRPIEVVSAQLCFAGAGNKENTEKLQQHIKGRVASNDSDVEVLTDAELLLNAHPQVGASSALDVAVIAGTGSITVARNKEGGLERTGGFGPLLGDLGAGYRVGLMGIKAITEDLDSGSAPEKKTSMTSTFMQEHGLKVKADLVPFLYGKDVTEQKAAIAGSSKLVFDAAAAGDAVAKSILAQAAASLGEEVAMLCKRLGASTCRLAAGGGLLVKQDAYRQQVVDAITKNGVKVENVVLVDDPALHVAKVAASKK